MNPASRLTGMLSIGQAADASSSLAALQERIRESQWCLEQIRPCLPPALGRQVKAGPVDDQSWCLLVSNTAAASKLRQLLPALQRELTQKGSKVTAIRLKVQNNSQ